MKKKTVFYTEAAYLAGILTLALGTALMERADFGMSMVVAPAYLIHLKVSERVPFYSFGMSEYILQAVLLCILPLLVGRMKKTWIFSFCTAVFYGFALDGCMALAALVPCGGIAGRTVFYLLGLVVCAVGIAFLFRTYLPPEAYELFVKELSLKTGKRIELVKTVYDCVSCLAAVVLSFAFFGFGRFEGVKLGTVFCALVNGWLIGRAGCLLERCFEFRDGLRWRAFFER